MRLSAKVAGAAILWLAASSGAGHGANPPLSAPATGSDLLKAFTQQTVPVGRTSRNDRWRCMHKVGDTLYYSTGHLESQARARLESYLGTRVYCEPREEILFPF